MPSVAVCFYYHLKNDHKLSILDQHAFTRSQFPWVRSPATAWLGPMLRVPQDCWQGISQDKNLHLQGDWRWICFQAHSGSWQNALPTSCSSDPVTFRHPGLVPWEKIFPWTGGVMMVCRWFKCITFTMQFISLLKTLAPPQIMRH